VKARLQRQALLQNGDKDVDGHCNPDLSRNGIAVVARNALLELVRRKVIHQLGENDAADMHASLSKPVVGRSPEAGIIPGKFKSKNLRGPFILFTSLRSSVSFEAIAGH